MDNVSKAGMWLNRVVLLICSFLFFNIGLKSLVTPQTNAVKSHLILNSATAFSVVRVSMGAFPLGLSFIFLCSLFLKRGILSGILSVFIIALITTVTRIASLVIDGHSDFGRKVLIPEIIITVLSFTGLVLELRRRKRYRKILQ